MGKDRVPLDALDLKSGRDIERHLSDAKVLDLCRK